MLKINAGFSTVYIKFDEGANQDFEAHLKCGDIKFSISSVIAETTRTNEGESEGGGKH